MQFNVKILIYFACFYTNKCYNIIMIEGGLAYVQKNYGVFKEMERK